MSRKHPWPSFETSRKCAAPQDDGGKTSLRGVIARSPCDEAIQPAGRRSGPLDCFAHRAARRAARWLAMTQTFTYSQDDGWEFFTRSGAVPASRPSRAPAAALA
jgi:hypothetical protein